MGKELISWTTYDDYPDTHDERISCCIKALKMYKDYISRAQSNGYKIVNQLCTGAYFYETNMIKEGEEMIYHKRITIQFKEDCIFTLTCDENIDKKGVKK